MASLIQTVHRCMEALACGCAEFGFCLLPSLPHFVHEVKLEKGILWTLFDRCCADVYKYLWGWSSSRYTNKEVPRTMGAANGLCHASLPSAELAQGQAIVILQLAPTRPDGDRSFLFPSRFHCAFWLDCATNLLSFIFHFLRAPASTFHKSTRYAIIMLAFFRFNDEGCITPPEEAARWERDRSFFASTTSLCWLWAVSTSIVLSRIFRPEIILASLAIEIVFLWTCSPHSSQRYQIISDCCAQSCSFNHRMRSSSAALLNRRGAPFWRILGRHGEP